jgi:hypothetical protein
LATMVEREAHLVDGLPGSTASDGIRLALELLGPRLRSLPTAPDSYPAFVTARAAAGLPGLAWQHALTGDLDMVVRSHGPAGALRSRRSFTEAIWTEIREVSATTAPDTLFAVDMRAEPALLAGMPPQVRPAMARVLARPVIGLAAGSAPGIRFAVHARLSGVRNLRVGSLRDVNPLVLLINAIAGGWPEDRPLDLLHVELASADRIPDQAAYCRPLQQLRLPAGSRLSVGLADETRPLAEQRALRGVVEDNLGAPMVIAARNELDGRGALQRIAELCEA